MGNDHAERIKQELRQAGVTSYGLLKMESRYLPKIVHLNEHIGGVIYGRNELGSMMVVATNLRVIILDCKPFFANSDELTYDTVAGVRSTTSGPFSAVTLHTRMDDFSLKFVNSDCARRFVSYMEERRIEQGTYDQISDRYNHVPAQAMQPVNWYETQAVDYVRHHNQAVLSTVTQDGLVNGAVVHYFIDQNNHIYIVSPSEKTSVSDIWAHEQVALTVQASDSAEAAQIVGRAEPEANKKIRDQLIDYALRTRLVKSVKQLTPLAKIKEGLFTVIHIVPQQIKLVDHSQI